MMPSGSFELNREASPMSPASPKSCCPIVRNNEESTPNLNLNTDAWSCTIHNEKISNTPLSPYPTNFFNTDDETYTSMSTSSLETLMNLATRRSQLSSEMMASAKSLELINSNRAACAVDLEYKETLSILKQESNKLPLVSSKCPLKRSSSLSPNEFHENRSHLLLRSIYNAQLSAALHLDNPSRPFLDLLNEVTSLMSCQYSFIGELKYGENSQPYLHSHAISFARMKLTQEAKDLFSYCSSTDFKFNNMNSLFGHVLTTGEPVLTNDPKNHPNASINHIPKGHPPLNSFLGLPFMYNNQLVGMIGIANKEGGFHEDDIKFLEPICATCASIIVSWRFYFDREEAREMLKLANLDLEQRINQRTEDLVLSNLKLKEEVERRKKMEQELLEQKKISERIILEKEQFLRNVSHDCRTPLSCILGLSDLLLGSSEQYSQDHLEYLSMIKNSGETMLNLINDFLDLMKLEQHMKLNSDLFFPNEPIEDVIDLVVLECSKKNLDLIVDYQPQFPFNILLNSDLGRTKQVLLNLLSNAVKFTNHGFIHVGVQIIKNCDREAQLEVVVRDTGCGIDRQNLPRIGQPFLQFNSSNTVSKGTGLGVSISKMIANALGGNLKVESEGLGLGSKFIFTCKVPYREFHELSFDERELIKKRNAKQYKLISSWENAEKVNTKIQTVLLAKSTLFSESLQNFALSFETLYEKNISPEQLTICEDQKSLKQFIQEQKSKLDYDCLQVVVDLQLLQHGESIVSICKELDIPHNLVKDQSNKPTRIQIIPIVQFSSVTDLGPNNVLVKPLFKLMEFTRLLKPYTFTDKIKQVNEKCSILAEEDLLRIADKVTVLIVDDNMINSKVLSHMLLKLGLKKISIASNGEEACASVQKQYFNIVFLDLFMDGMDGFETARVIKETCPQNAPNIVLLTANIVSKKEEEELSNNNVKYFMNKPTRFEDIRQLVLGIVRK